MSAAAPQRDIVKARIEDARWARQNRKVAYGSQVNAAPETSCCFRFAPIILWIVNILFFGMGVVMIALGAWGATGAYAEIVGQYPGLGLLVMGCLVVVFALLGQYGASKDNKCIVLLYFIVLFASLVVFIVGGAMATFESGSVDARFSNWWCEYSEAAAKGQDEFDCCGYNSPCDRPAGGKCGEVEMTLLSTTCPATTTNCDAYPGVPPAVQDLPGCKTKALEYTEARMVPLYACAFAFGLTLFLGLFVSGYLLCRRSNKSFMPRTGGFSAGADLNRVPVNEVNFTAAGPAGATGAGVEAAPRSAAAYVPSDPHAAAAPPPTLNFGVIRPPQFLHPAGGAAEHK